MVRSVAVGFGAVTMLALVGSMMLGGQAMLGIRHRAAAQAAPVEMIQDRPAPVTASVQSVVSTPVSSSRARARVHPAAPPTPRPQASSRPLGQSMDITQLLSLAQSPALANLLPTGGTPSGTALLPSILQQFADPAATPAPAAADQPAQVPTPTAPAQPNLAGAAVPLANHGGGKDAGDDQK